MAWYNMKHIAGLCQLSKTKYVIFKAPYGATILTPAKDRVHALEELCKAMGRPDLKVIAYDD